MRALIIAGAAKAFFACAWADMQEEQGGSLSGMEITDVMPSETDPAAIKAAEDVVAAFEADNTETIEEVYADHTGGLEPGRWGHYFAMQCMGHGVGLWEYSPAFDEKKKVFKMPYVEFYSWELEREYLVVSPRVQRRA